MLFEALAQFNMRSKLIFSARNHDLSYIYVHAKISQLQQRNLKTCHNDLLRDKILETRISLKVKILDSKVSKKLSNEKGIEPVM
jgi:hypothetical protein